MNSLEAILARMLYPFFVGEALGGELQRQIDTALSDLAVYATGCVPSDWNHVRQELGLSPDVVDVKSLALHVRFDCQVAGVGYPAFVDAKGCWRKPLADEQRAVTQNAAQAAIANALRARADEARRAESMELKSAADLDALIVAEQQRAVNLRGAADSALRELTGAVEATRSTLSGLASKIERSRQALARIETERAKASERIEASLAELRRHEREFAEARDRRQTCAARSVELAITGADVALIEPALARLRAAETELGFFVTRLRQTANDVHLHEAALAALASPRRDELAKQSDFRRKIQHELRLLDDRPDAVLRLVGNQTIEIEWKRIDAAAVRQGSGLPLLRRRLAIHRLWHLVPIESLDEKRQFIAAVNQQREHISRLRHDFGG